MGYTGTSDLRRTGGPHALCRDGHQPQQAKKVLDQNMSVSTALPCRISIYEEGGRTVLATLKPTTLLALFNTPELKGVAQEVEDTIVKIMTQAAST
ncbi:MAG TPA: DUF302 domain-containing protein [Candidatus Limnocylindrales bacterium]|nr:DUF302 domain-containing protein [Candidatus Limnocylindrales bacterium]